MTDQPDDLDLPLEVEDLLREVTPTLGSEAIWAAPDGMGVEAVLVDIRAEAATVPQSWSGSSPRRWLAIAGAAAAFVIGLVLGAVVLRGDGASGTEFAIDGGDGSSAIGVIERDESGWGIQLDIEGIDPAPDGHFYTAWVIGAAGPVPVGSFDLRDGGNDLRLWSGVSLGEYPTFAITLQAETDGPEPSETVIFAGDFES